MHTLFSLIVARTRPIRSPCGEKLLSTFIVVLAMLALAASAGPCSATTNKLVGVVFDDSGSMEGRTNLPVLGIQMLAASLATDDKLYGISFRRFMERGGMGIDPSALRSAARLKPYLIEFPLKSQHEQQRAIDDIRSWAKNPNVGTPFLPVEAMLSFLALAATPDDDVHFFLFTDGGFNDPANPRQAWKPDRAALGRRLNELKQNSKARSITVHFLAFVADSSEEQLIDEQGVAKLLDDTFNGGAGTDIFARDFQGLRQRLVNIIARIADVEPEDVRGGASAIVRRTGNSIAVTAPFTVTKIVVLSTAPDARGLPTIKQYPPGAPDGITFSARMEERDTSAKLPGTDGKLWNAKVTHIAPHPALPADREFTLTFDRPLTADTSVFLRTDITVDWDVYDANGAVVAPDANGVVNLAADQDYELRARIEDKNGASGAASLQNLPPRTKFTAIRRDPSGRIERDDMRVDSSTNRAISRLHYRETGADEIAVSVTMPGFVTARGHPVKINVIRTNLDVTLTTKPLVQCPRCSASRVEPQMSASMPWTPVMSVIAAFNARGPVSDGRVTFKLADPLPKGSRARIVGTSEVLEDVRKEIELPLKVANAIEIQFEVDSNFADTLPDGYKARLSAQTLVPLVGSGSTIFEIYPKLEDPKLFFAGTTDGTTGDEPLRLKPDAVKGRSGFYVRITNPFSALKLDDLQVSIAGLGLTPELQQDRALFRPYAPVCACFISSGRYNIDVTYRNAKGQTASLTGGYVIIEDVTLWERFLICLWIILGTAATIYLVCGIVRFIRSHRFPVRSRLLVYRVNKRADGHPKKLARRPWPLIMPFIMPFMNWDERRRIEGLSLKAGPDCVCLMPKGASAYQNLRRGAEARPVSAWFDNGNRRPLDIYWGDRLEELVGDERQTFEFLESTKSI